MLRYISNYFGQECYSDTLFNTFRPLGIVYSFISYFTFSNVFQHDSKKLKLNIFGVKTLLAASIQFYTTYLLIEELRFLKLFYLCICCIPSLVHMLVCLMTNEKLLDIFNSIEKIDNQLKNFEIIKTVNQRNRRVRVMYIFLFLNLCNFIIINLYVSTWQLLAQIQIYLVDFAIYQVQIMYLFFCDELCYRFKLLSSCFQYSISSGKYHLLEDIRLLHSRLFSVINLVFLCFSPRILNLILFILMQSISLLLFVFIMKYVNAFYVLKFAILCYIVLSTSTATDNLTKIVSML